jgi:hypothetical protein
VLSGSAYDVETHGARQDSRLTASGEHLLLKGVRRTFAAGSEIAEKVRAASQSTMFVDEYFGKFRLYREGRFSPGI